MYGDKTLYVLSRVGHYDEVGNPVPNAQFPAGEEHYQAFEQSYNKEILKLALDWLHEKGVDK